MGGGISLMEGGLEELLTTTIMIGRAISAVTFPGMYRIYDFHSKRAPRLKNAKQFTFFAPDSDDEDEDEYVVPEPEEYEHFFKVMVSEDAIYLEHPTERNESGWTPLHACCMSMSTVQAAFLLIDETVRRGQSFEIKTTVGPGTFNKGWTVLHMACAYGAEPIVDKLIQCGANVNSINSFGFSCLLEACHRGFFNVVKSLVESKKIDFSYIPTEDDAQNSPFSSAPCQSALAEAARCGFYKVVELLLDSGAPKDLPNAIGWTALHEACFYNRIETVKMLLSHGASCTIRTRLGALPYHLAGLQEVRNLLMEVGGNAAVPSEGDVIDMIEILTELTMPQLSGHGSGSSSSGGGGGQFMISFGGGGGAQMFTSSSRPANTLQNPSNNFSILDNEERITRQMEDVHFEPKANPFVLSSRNNVTRDINDIDENEMSAESEAKQSSGSSGKDRADSKHARSDSKQGDSTLLHSGPMLGDLPTLPSPTKSPGKPSFNAINSLTNSSLSDVDRALALSEHVQSQHQWRPSGNHNSLLGGGGQNALQPSRKADSKNKKKKTSPEDEVPKDMPREFLCQLTQRPMSEPMKTVYGNVYDRTAIMNWLNTQGKICPLTGAPLSEVDLKPVKELGDEIRKWILQRSLNNGAGESAANQTAATATEKKKNATTTDDLYDF